MSTAKTFLVVAVLIGAVEGLDVGYPAISRPNFDVQEREAFIPEPYRSLGVSGFLSGWSVYLRNKVGCVRLQIWRPVKKAVSVPRSSARPMTTPRALFRQYTLIGQTDCYRSAVNDTSVTLKIPQRSRFRVEATDVLGMQYQDTNPVPFSYSADVPCADKKSQEVITNYERVLKLSTEYQFTIRPSGRGCKLYSLTATIEDKDCFTRKARKGVQIVSSTAFTGYADHCWLVTNGLSDMPLTPDSAEVRIKVAITELGVRRSANCSAGRFEVRAGMSSTSPLVGQGCDADTSKLVFRVATNNIYIRYIRNDRTNETKRFSAEYSVILGPDTGQNKTRVACQEVTVSDVPVYIRSPNYPEDYPADAEVCWVFSVTNDEERVRIEVEDGQLQPPGECKVNGEKNTCTFKNCFDYIEVRDGSDRKAALLTTWCDHTGNPLVETGSDRKVVVSFFSDSSIQAKGFKIKAYAIHKETARCTHYLASAVETFFNSPNYPYYYPPNRDDCWVIHAADPRGRVMLTAYDSQTSDTNSATCLQDWLEVRDGVGAESQVIRRWCSETVPETIVSSGRFLRVRFVSDGTRRGTGFHIGFREVVSDACPVYYVRPTLAYMSQRPLSGPGPVVSCWVLRAVSDRIQLFWNGNRVELPGSTYAHPCSHEGLEVREGSSHDAPLIGRYCAYSPMPLEGVTSNSSTLFLRAVSDTIPSYATFNISYRHMTSRHCHYFVLTERDMWVINTQPGVTTSRPRGKTDAPNHPGNKPQFEPYCDRCTYEPKADTCWVIEAEPGEKVALRSVYVDLQEQNKDTGLCDTDFVEIKDGGEPEAPLLDVVCGKRSPFNMTSSGQFMYIHFRSDESKQYRGFKFKVKALKGDTCEHREAYNWGQTLRSPGYPTRYTANLDMCWVITSPGKQSPVKLTVQQIDLQAGDDFIEVYDGPDGDSPLLKRWEHRSEKPSPVISTGQSLYLRFRTDSRSAGNQGLFSFVFHAVQIAQCRHLAVGEDGVEITSPGYPESYKPNDFACWVATARSPMDTIHVEVDTLLLEDHVFCRADFIELRDGPDEESSLLHRWCGHMNDESLVSTGRSVYIKFIADSHKQDMGFKLRLSLASQSGGAVRSGLGKSNVLTIVLIIIAVLLAIVILIFIVRAIVRRRKPTPPVFITTSGQGVTAYPTLPPAYPGSRGAEGGGDTSPTKEPSVNVDTEGRTAEYSNTSEQLAESSDVILQPNGGPS